MWHGYLALTVFLHIANARFADFLEHDLPMGRHNAVLAIARSEHDEGEHVCVPAEADFSPSTMNLIVSGFLALTALLPLARDPITRVPEMDKG